MSEKLKEEDARKYKIISRILSVLLRIVHVLCWIGVGCVAVTTIASTAIAPNVKINRDAKEIVVFDETINYDFKDKEIEFGEGDEKVLIKNNEIVFGKNNNVISVKLSDETIRNIEKIIENDAMKIIAVLPYALALITVAFIFIALAMGHIASIFKNIATKKTPFIEENVTRCEKMAKYFIISYVITFVCNLIMAVVTDGKAIAINGGSIVFILGIYVAIYVLKSGIANGSKKEEKKD